MATITTFAYDAVGGVPSYTSGNIIDWLYQLTFRANGVLPGSDGGLAVSTDGTGNALVQNGVCALGGRTAVLTAGPQSVAMSPLPANGFRTSYAIVMRYNTATQTTALVAIAGSTIANPGPAVNPSIVALTDVLLAYVLAVNTGSIAYTVTDARTFTDTGTFAPTGSTTYTASDLNINSAIIAPITGNSTIDITAGSIYKGTRLFIKNTTSGSYTLTVHYSGSLGDISLVSGAWIALTWDGSVWVNTTVNSDWDLVIDSNAKLDLWCQHTGGLYKRVLIRAGTWTASALSPTAGVLVNLTAAGTTYIFAEKGAVISYTGSYNGMISGLYRSSAVADVSSELNDGINISITNSGFADSSACGFNTLKNLNNCSSSVTVQSNTFQSYGYFSCEYLYNCIAKFNNSGKYYGFHGCNYIVNCLANITSSNTFAINGYSGCTYISNSSSVVNSTASSTPACYYLCVRLSNCKANMNGTGSSAYGFSSCSFVSTCYAGIITTGSSGSCVGFNNSTQLSSCEAVCQPSGSTVTNNGYAGCTELSSCDCTMVATGSANGYCYNTCNDVSACKGASTGSTSGVNTGMSGCNSVIGCRMTATNPGAGTGYAFGSCKKMQQNVNTSSKTGGYTSCYADSGTANAVADTAAGGYNS